MFAYLASLSFTKKYILALSLIASFSILAFINLTQIISSQANDGEVINLSGRQRMLSQKIALFAINYKTKELEETINLMENSHNKLMKLAMSEKVKSVYFQEPIMLNERVKKYIYYGHNFTKNRDGRSLTYLLENSQSLLRNLDVVVSIYQGEAENKIKNMRNNELYILVLTLLVLVFEALFIFRPIDKSVKKKTQELLSEKDYSDMITQINTNAIVAVNEKFEILTFNKSAENIFGYTAQEMLNTKLIDDRIIPIKYLDMHNTGLANFMKNGKLKNKNIVFELEGQHKDKTIFPIRISFGVKPEEGHRIVVANIQDITKEKNKDAIIIEQSRFAAMGEMIGNIAHQWRQPLSAISTIASGAKLRYKNNMLSDEELEKTFDKIKDYTMHLSNTIDDFKDFFSESKELEVFNIKDVVERSISLTEAAYIDNKIKVNINILDDALTLKGSSSELSQVFLNILNNAKDVFIEKEIEQRVVLIRIRKDENELSISIKDSAGGISKDIKGKIFEPYFTTKHKSQGTGIGLFMSKKIIEQHYNGTLQSTNEEFSVDGKNYFGASLNIRIPLHYEV